MENQEQAVAQEQAVSPVLSLEFSLDQINGILNLLGKLPYESSAGLIELVRSQAIQKLNELQVANEEAAAESEETSAEE